MQRMFCYISLIFAVKVLTEAEKKEALIHADDNRANLESEFRKKNFDLEENHRNEIALRRKVAIYDKQIKEAHQNKETTMISIARAHAEDRRIKLNMEDINRQKQNADIALNGMVNAPNSGTLV